MLSRGILEWDLYLIKVMSFLRGVNSQWWGVYGLYRETRESETREEVIGTRRKKRDKGLAFWGESFGDGGKGKVQEKYIGGGLTACRGWFDLIYGETGQRKPRIEDNFQKHGGIFQ